MHKLNASCHCRNVQVRFELRLEPQTYNPRACDCDFCVKHGAAYVSDPHGSLFIQVKDQQLLRKYRQGSGTAEFLICGNCGVLVAITYQSDGKIFGAVNAGTVDGTASFGERKVVSPKALSAGEKTERWETLWFPSVSIAYKP